MHLTLATALLPDRWEKRNNLTVSAATTLSERLCNSPDYVPSDATTPAQGGSWAV